MTPHFHTDMKLGRRTLLFLIILLSMFGPISTDMYLSGLPTMIDYFDTVESVMNMSLYFFMLVFAISILFLGPVSEKYGRRNTLAVSLFLYIVANIACCFTSNVWVFIALRMVQAIGGGGAVTTAFALIKDCFCGNDMKQALSITAALGILGPILAPVIGTVLINLINWQATFWVPAIIAALCLAVGLMLPAELPAERYDGPIVKAVGRLKAVMADRNFARFTIMMCIFTGAQLAYIAVSSYIYQDDFGFTTTEYSIALASACVLGLLLSYALRGIRSITNRKMISALFILGILSLVMMTFLADKHWSMMLIAMVPCCAITVTARAYGYNLLMAHHEGDNGAVSSVLNFATFIFAFIGMVISSSFPSDIFTLGIATVLLICCVVYAVMWMLLRKDGYPIKGLQGE